MTNQEFSNEFDVLYNNIMSNQAPGLDEYEKSVFLTKAQDEIVKNYFNPKGNKYNEGFDGNEKRQIDFSMIIRSTVIKTRFTDDIFDARCKTVILPKDIIMILNEYALVTRMRSTGDPESAQELVRLTIVPLEYKEYSRLMSKPYKRPLKWQAWRLLNNSTTDNSAEIMTGPNDILNTYNIRYIKKPRAIILSDLEGVTLDGQSKAQTCELDPILHPEILQRAVELAKAAYVGDINSQVQMGQRSE
nr:MAG: hypothetical protein [Bacteriophage sp.]